MTEQLMGNLPSLQRGKEAMSDVPKGYKMSEMGVIPEEWEIDKIKNISSITTGAKNTQDKIDDAEYPFFVRSSIVERIDSYSFDGVAVLTAGDGVGTGKVFHYINGKFDFHQRVYKISDFSEKIDGYFFYLIFSNYFLKRIMAMTAKSSVDSVRMDMIAEMPIPLPPLPEQQAIASTLSDVAALITTLEQLITKKRNIKQGAMQQLITGKKRLPGFGGEWEVKKLGEVLKVRHGKSQKSVNDENGLYPILATGGEIGRANAYLYNKPSVLIGRKGTIDVPQYMETPFWTIDTLFFTEISDNTNPKYIFYKFNLIDWYSYNEASGVPSLNTSTIEKIELLFPPTDKEQQAIAKILSDMDTEMEALEQKRNTYKAIKQGMMQDLLTGKRRLA
jgi:type I restriction enzyme S subunit